MSELDPIEREFYRLEAKVQAMEERLAFLNSEVTGLRSDVRELVDFMQNAKGGWKTLAMVGGFTSAITALVIKIIEVLPR